MTYVLRNRRNIQHLLTVGWSTIAVIDGSDSRRGGRTTSELFPCIGRIDANRVRFDWGTGIADAARDEEKRPGTTKEDYGFGSHVAHVNGTRPCVFERHYLPAFVVKTNTRITIESAVKFATVCKRVDVAHLLRHRRYSLPNSK